MKKIILTFFLITTDLLLFSQSYDDYIAKTLNELDNGNHINAISLCNKAIEIDSNNDYGFIFRGLAKFKLGDIRGAISDFDKAISINIRNEGNNVYLLRGIAQLSLNNNIKAIEDLSKSIEFYSKDNEVSYAKRAEAKLNIKDYKSSSFDCLKSIELNPNYSEPYLICGMLCLVNGNPNDAIEFCDMAIKISPKYGKVFFIRGSAKLQLNDIENGCLDLSKAGELGFSQAYDFINKFCK